MEDKSVEDKNREILHEMMEVETHSGQYLPIDVFETTYSGGKHNYFGKYVPEEFWRLYGKVYYNLFRKPEDTAEDSTKPGDRMDMNVGGLIGRLPVFHPESVLEVGCGFGRCLAYVHASCPPIKRLEGIELSPTMVEQAHKYLANYEHGDKMKVIQGDAKKLPYKDDEFDVIYTHVCLTHIPPEFIDDVTSEISRVAKKGIIHIERYHFPYEHPNPHRWTHDLAGRYLKLGWKVHEFDTIGKNPEHHTKVLVLTK